MSKLPIYPVVLGATYVLTKFLEAWAPVEVLFRPLVVVTVAAALVLIVASLALGRHRGAWLLAAVLMLLVEVPVALLLVLVVIVFAIASRRAGGKAAMPWPRLTPLLNAISVLTLAFTLVRGLGEGAFYIGSQRPDVAVRGTPGPTSPDIYLVLLDAHPRWDTLFGLGVDSGPFQAAMVEMDFDLQDGTHSNYNNTALALSSMFNATQVNDLLPNPPDGIAAQARALNRLINHGSVLQKARELGFEIVALPAEIGYVSLFAADQIVNAGTLSEFELGLTQEDIARQIAPGELFGIVLEEHRRRVIGTFDALGNLAVGTFPRPRLIFAHILAPHPPIVFDSLGGPVEVAGCVWTLCQLSDPMTDEDLALVQGQLTYIDSLVQRTARAIVEQSERPAVIVFFSDHGFRLNRRAEDHTEWFRSFLLARTPGKPFLIPANATPINYLARILNGYYDAQIPLAPEGSFERPREGPTNGFFPLLPIRPT